MPVATIPAGTFDGGPHGLPMSISLRRPCSVSRWGGLVLYWTQIPA